MIGLLVSLLILAIVVYIVYLILAQIAMPAPIKTIVYLIVGLILLLVLLDQFGLYHMDLGGVNPVPGKERCEEIVRESVDRAKLMAGNIGVAIHPMGGATEGSIDDCATHAHVAIDQAAKAAKILVRERE